MQTPLSVLGLAVSVPEYKKLLVRYNTQIKYPIILSEGARCSSFHTSKSPTEPPSTHVNLAEFSATLTGAGWGTPVEKLPCARDVTRCVTASMAKSGRRPESCPGVRPRVSRGSEE
jgi:hypothetical protein